MTDNKPQPKFNFFDKVKAKNGKVFDITQILYSKSESFFSFSGENVHAYYPESELELYKEPEWEYQYLFEKADEKRFAVTQFFYKSDEDFKQNCPDVTNFKRIDESKREVK